MPASTKIRVIKKGKTKNPVPKKTGQIPKKNEQMILRSKKSKKKEFEPRLTLSWIMDPGLNHLYFYESVSRESVDKLIRQLKCIQLHDRGLDVDNGQEVGVVPNAIVLHIHSYGGCVYSGLEALMAIEGCKRVPVMTVVDGVAASAATWLAIAGQRRFVMPQSHMLIHELSTGKNGRVKWSDVVTDYQHLKVLMKTISEIYIKRTPLTQKELNQIMHKDLYWNAKECAKHLNMEILN